MQLDRFKVNLLLKELREGESSVTSLSLLGILDLSQLEPEYLLAVFDKLKEFGAVYQYLDEHPQPRQHCRLSICDNWLSWTNTETAAATPPTVMQNLLRASAQ